MFATGEISARHSYVELSLTFVNWRNRKSVDEA
jgi:hypothetical protein